ncbi:hypothetical protein [Methylobacterium frigidaeris]|uniref:Uncharacterized protein n=1 Tax=Methylobacterium frigidaeris TaxID=2038277 RepID=A0AA37H634_9HYPH|nr:hypothetical protein [Methylobacterium frigidaeris]PIK70667.1 hypothetical protein CS379_23430 [Methylobacterium frigidaeris]GJD60153.1 hypothetical protein MPEAHAMD_0288 [Methylobacterium frigidaeris]
MSNVVPLLRPRPAPDAAARATAAVVSDLVTIAEQLHDIGARAAALGRPRTEAERTVQMVLDAVTSIERALDTITDGGDFTPF